MEREALTIIEPKEIEKQSFAIIERELMERYQISLEGKTAPVVRRVIHTTADFDYARRLYFSPGVMEAAEHLLRAGGFTIVTDTAMAMAGVSKSTVASLQGQVVCFMQDETVANEAAARGVTRATVSMEYAAEHIKEPVFVIGNAPTALVSIYDLYMVGRVKPCLIIAAPVGFVNVTEAKELIRKLPVPMIVTEGRQGGSNVAAAIMNALLYEVRR